MKPLVSVIIPMYNVEAYIWECLESVRTQIFHDFEAIIVNDGTKDNSAVLAEEFIKKHQLKNFRIIHKENGGLSSARNAGIAVAQGEWFAFLDSDDYIREDYLQSFVLQLQKFPADYYQAGYSKYYQHTGLLTVGSKPPCFHGLFTESMDKIVFTYVLGKFYSAKIIADHHLRFDEQVAFGEDRCFNFDYLQYVNRCTFFDNVSQVYRRSDNSMTETSTRPEKKKSMYAHARAFWKSFSDESFIKEKFRHHYHLAHNITDSLLVEIINAVLSGNDESYRQTALDPVAIAIVNCYYFPDAPKKEQLLVSMIRRRMLRAAKLVIRLYYNDFVFRKTRRFFGRSLRK